MADERVELSLDDRKRIDDLIAQAMRPLQQIASIQATALGERHAELVERTRSKSIRAIRWSTTPSAPVVGGAGRLEVDTKSYCVSYGSGPNMAMCYDEGTGTCYLTDGFE
jgi:hypothetical protein